MYTHTWLEIHLCNSITSCNFMSLFICTYSTAMQCSPHCLSAKNLFLYLVNTEIGLAFQSCLNPALFPVVGMGYKGLEIPQKGHRIVHTFQGLSTPAKPSTQHSKALDHGQGSQPRWEYKEMTVAVLLPLKEPGILHLYVALCTELYSVESQTIHNILQRVTFLPFSWLVAQYTCLADGERWKKSKVFLSSLK